MSLKQPSPTTHVAGTADGSMTLPWLVAAGPTGVLRESQAVGLLFLEVAMLESAAGNVGGGGAIQPILSPLASSYLAKVLLWR